ncbi:MAG: chondroitinase family polysaccharide lyase [Flavobacteriaceae bacterium]|nr:chondroitinase family polysaccharide lyase [Flavobacteriaceae bacterium]
MISKYNVTLNRMTNAGLKIPLFLKIEIWYPYLLLFCTGVIAQNPMVESFEDSTILEKYDQTDRSFLNLSSSHYQFGQQSLSWEWNEKQSAFGTAHFKINNKDLNSLAYSQIFPVSPVIVLSIYNETPQKGTITILFQKEGLNKAWFSLPLQFKGWRTIRVPFFEMEGDVPKMSEPMEYDYFKVIANTSKGKLFFDDIVFLQNMDNRHPYPDLMVPFIKKNQIKNANHWMPLVENLKRLEEIREQKIRIEEVRDLNIIKNRINESLFFKENSNAYEEALLDFQSLGISTQDEYPLGPPLTHNQHEVYFDSIQQGPKSHNNIRDFGKTLQKVANAFVRCKDSIKKNELESKFILASRYFLDQGWQKGVSGGTRHHIGYSTRELTRAFYMMRESLLNVGLLEETGQSLQWLNNLGKILGDEKEFNVNIDYLNTQSYYHLLTIYLVNSTNKQVALLKAFSNYLSVILSQEDKEGGFKPDGTSWHHSGHYPAYGMGGFLGTSEVIHKLSGTIFRIEGPGFENFKKALLTTTEYSQTYDWGFGNSGRHPLESSYGGNSIKPLKRAFWQMAHSGTHSEIENIDRDIAAAYIRLWGDKDTVSAKKFKKLGVHPQILPGYKVLPYAATAIHRRNNWAAIIKGYNKYVWSSEIYSNSNRYGRYQSNGTIELLNETGEVGSGIVQHGWDWNRYPGATIIYYPLEELETEKSLLMFLSNESFAGAARLGRNGVFGMKLNESTGTNADGHIADRTITFPGKLKAKKSVFSFGNKLICIGTDISSVDSTHPVQTNLFQTYLKSPTMPFYLDGYGKVDEFPFSSNTGNWIVDPYGNGYHILSGSMSVHRKSQHSYHNKYSVRTGAIHGGPRGAGFKETQGNFSTAWLDHGFAPKQGKYAYVIYPFLSKKDQGEFENKANNDESYHILRADGTAHIVMDIPSATTGYVIFETDKNLDDKIIKKVSSPAIMMLKEHTSENITLNIVQPDLHFPINNNKNGFTNYSLPVKITLILKGKWNLDNIDGTKVIHHSNEETIVTVECQHGFSNVLDLKK